MSNFISLLIGIRDLALQGLSYLLERFKKDKRFLAAVILGVVLVILLFSGVRSLIQKGKTAAQEAAQDPESQMVIPIEMNTISPTPVAASETGAVFGGALPGMNAMPMVQASATPQALAGSANGGALIGATSSMAAGASTSSGGVTVVNEYLNKKNGGIQVPIVQQSAEPSPLADYDYEATYFDGAVQVASSQESGGVDMQATSPLQ